jgi:hypothetical protein
MRYLVRWEYRGAVHEAFTNSIVTAFVIYEAVQAYFAHERVPVSMWEGATKIREALS